MGNYYWENNQQFWGRKRRMKKTVLAFTMVLAVISGVAAETFGDFHDVTVVRVYDGDTFFADIESVHALLGDEIGIRVRDIDTPEIRGKCDQETILADQARQLVEDRLADATSVDLIDVERGKYFRIVATVVVDGVELAQILIDRGLAVPYDGDGPKRDWCE